MSITIEDNLTTVTVDSTNIDVVTVENTNVAVTVDTAIEVVTVGIQGPAGADGGDGVLTYTAGESLGGHRIVRADGVGSVFYADKDTSAHKGKVLGLTTGAVVISATASVQTAGEMEEASWTWIAGPVYLSTNGTLTQTAPTTGFVQEIGVALTATKMLIRVIDPITRV